ncbi:MULTISPECIES: NADH-quinone oxidoreductase subunit NuoF [Clostridium]|jgi:NADH-quinone oxidoreductase subunit F|uniref:NADP-reducing hydrogenase subunit HndC n=3 Tax=Clostridium TaxID=1485 RepID=M1MPI0_9CLOT|nr:MULTISPECIES: NADH-quinone oxidoreductase subunit NuoF [Clostridium]AGF58128.1 NADP-reducing hydrogenase subunit HndC [Clostridium saccharoperbutylacetonicum N1-4(HMT)]AQR96817.1 NADP-reducing hydrogenase subunit HndC [Clostridium saccharoperbutylacetonicum]NRT61098.1 NADH-quinone oxidoreductase subunit F [Clostridium saccharoperbutylacetonicum]NSB24413.1 NADH-quinone oxidoreductase subunit F [Clostridium saccharoperbutylacetonicum]NSB43789.1 NADH-quinone oxidoreductase subunit F [Clostridi
MLLNRNDLINTRELYKKSLIKEKKKILICAGTGCVAGGSLDIYEEFIKLMKEKEINCEVSLEKEPHDETVGIKKSGCHGFCEMGPLVRIEPFGYLYIKVKPEDCAEILEKTIINDECVERLAYTKNGEIYKKQEEIPFYKKQTRLALEHCGHIDATSIEEYLAIDGYSAFEKVLFDMKADEVIKEIEESNLRGRGGGGFPAGRKWSQVSRQKEEIRYIVCNGDEGDPGAFMDRSIMEGDPHRMLEGMMIAGVACGAQKGYIYVRAEYPLAVSRLSNAIEQARKYGILGENILGTGFSFDLQINRGAGAFVCGEGSALTASIEGKRGMPRVKPPRTVEQGLFGKPTVLNNVETFANVPIVINKGAEWYRSIGPENSPGTKAFALTGNIENTGLIEVPMGTTLREVIFDIGGGIRDGKKFKAVQIGGPSGGCLTAEHLDLPLDFDSLKKAGAMIGSGGLVVMDEDTCMVEVARFFMNFTKNESCGKCVPCREGTKRMLEILEGIVAGKGKLEDMDMLLELADTISATALCGLGKTAPSPVVSTIKNFKDEYIKHIVDKKCPSKTCQKLKTILIDPSMCKGCSKCSKVCPVGAISGKIKEPFVIDQNKCIKCGACLETCPFKAIKED